MRLRRGGAVLLALLVMFALLSVALTALSVVAASAAAVEREYRSSQALALAEAGLAMAKSGAGNPASAGARRFEEGEASWTRAPRRGGWEVQAVGVVSTPTGRKIRRAVRADLERRHGRWVVLNWREESLK